MEPLSLLLALASLQVSLLQIQVANAYIQPLPMVERASTTEEMVEYRFRDIPTMIKVAKCESHFRQFDENGEVLKGESNPKDKGVFQINEDYWLQKSIELGFDIETTEGNIGFARYLYNTQATGPWKASRHCWNRKL